MMLLHYLVSYYIHVKTSVVLKKQHWFICLCDVHVCLCACAHARVCERMLVGACKVCICVGVSLLRCNMFLAISPGIHLVWLCIGPAGLPLCLAFRKMKSRASFPR